MKKWISVLLIISIIFSLKGCNIINSIDFDDFPLTTIWTSENPKMNIYLNGRYGDFVTKDGEYVTFEYHPYMRSLIGGGEYVELIIQEDGIISGRTVFHCHHRLDQNHLILEIDSSDFSDFTDENITEIVLDRKDAEETGFFKDPHLICESPDMYLEFGENDIYGVLTSKDHEIMLFEVYIWSKIKDKMGISVSLNKGYFSKYGFSSKKNSLILTGTITAEDGKYIFKIDDSYIGKVFEENITEFELKPAAENQIKDLEQINQQVNADQLSSEER